MKVKRIGSDDIISVYKFMEMCGLHCDVKSNIHISHEIMMRKLKLRGNKFPQEIIVPGRASLSKITTENVKNGSIILVIDDCKNILPYYHPRKMVSFESLNEDERTNKREELIEEKLSEEEIGLCDGEKITPGLARYLQKKEKKILELEKKALIELLAEDMIEQQFVVTEKIDREDIKERKKRYYY